MPFPSVGYKTPFHLLRLSWIDRLKGRNIFRKCAEVMTNFNYVMVQCDSELQKPLSGEENKTETYFKNNSEILWESNGLGKTCHGGHSTEQTVDCNDFLWNIEWNQSNSRVLLGFVYSSCNVSSGNEDAGKGLDVIAFFLTSLGL